MLNKGVYSDEELLALSGIQHFAFCERQWALIHVEKEWSENRKTVEGKQLHERVDDPYFSETRDNAKVVRSVPVVSRQLGLYGVADVVEYTISQDGDKAIDYQIVEYKRGKPKPDDRDEVQLCAQAICLEEMLGIKLNFGYFYYGETRRRHKVMFNKQLRERVKQLSINMHSLYENGITPAAKKDNKCRYCSLFDSCLPTLGKKKNSVKTYIKKIFLEMEDESAGV